MRSLLPLCIFTAQTQKNKLMKKIILGLIMLLSFIGIAQPGTFDLTFDPQSGANGPVLTTAIQSDGKIIIGGGFSTYSETARKNIARLNADGTLDTAFSPGTGANAFIHTATIQSDGKVIIGGDFTNFNGTAINRIARLNADGSLDTDFNPGAGANSSVETIAIQSDGKIFIGGSFNNFNGTLINRIVRLNADGTLDTSFDPLNGADGRVETASIQSDGKIIIGGSFTNLDGIGIRSIARLNADGTLDTSFNGPTGPTGEVETATIQSDGKVIIGGNFSNFSGTAINRIARLNADGTLDTDFNPGTGANWSTVETTAIQSDGKIIIGGTFTSFNGTGRNRVARVNGGDAIVTPPAPTADAQSFCAGATVNNLVATGTNLKWYTAVAGGSALPSVTVLTTGTYYVSQTINGAESNRTSVAVTITPQLLWYADTDGDTYGNPAVSLSNCTQPAGYVLNNTDCDDTNNTIFPGAPEVCYDGLDNDCDGIIDNGCTPIITALQPSLCGTTLPAINTFVVANLVPGAQGYRFRVTNLATSEVQTIDRFLRVFRITQLTNYAFATAYSVDVSVRINNVWQPFYGTPCTVSTPDITTQIRSSQCNSSLTNLNDVIFADLVPFATGYRFRVTNTLNPIDVQTIDRPIRDLRMSLLSNIQYNTTYSVDVAVRNTDGTYLSYGSVCNITTPLFPTTFLQDSQCDDYQVTSNTETLFAESFAGVEQYRFLLTNEALSYSQSVDRFLRTVNLNNFTGLLPTTTYSVNVAIQLNGVWGPYGKTCTIITPAIIEGRILFTKSDGSMDSSITGEFKAVAYPNPFANNFAINLRSNETSIVSLAIYDMTGRLLETREIKAEELSNQSIGDRYPSGIYNVVVNQGEQTQTIRVVKQ